MVNVPANAATPAVRGWRRSTKRYQGKGLVVLGIPANDFGAQERRSNKEIAEFCKAKTMA